jgi:hypothetical protein
MNGKLVLDLGAVFQEEDAVAAALVGQALSPASGRSAPSPG